MIAPKSLLRILIHGRSDERPKTRARIVLRWTRIGVLIVTGLVTLYAAGDIVANAQTQLSVAMGTGATAAIWLHKELLPGGKCLSGREW